MGSIIGTELSFFLCMFLNISFTAGINVSVRKSEQEKLCLALIVHKIPLNCFERPEPNTSVTFSRD